MAVDSTRNEFKLGTRRIFMAKHLEFMPSKLQTHLISLETGEKMLCITLNPLRFQHNIIAIVLRIKLS